MHREVATTPAEIEAALTALFDWEIDVFVATRDGFDITVALESRTSGDRARVVHTGGSHTLCDEYADLWAVSARLWGMLGQRVR